MNAYGIYLMATIIQHHCGLHGDAQDLHWEFACDHHAKFCGSQWDNKYESEYDCIEAYVKHQSENDPDWPNPEHGKL
jgi:hypothetical protein